MWAARKRGFLFDVGLAEVFGFESPFPAIKQELLPDTISTGMDKSSIMLPRAT